MKNILLKILVIALSISAVLGIVIILFDVKSDTAEKILITSLFVFGFSIPGLCCSTIYEKKHRKPLSIAGIITCLSGCIYFLLIIWEISDFDFLHDLEWKLMLLFPIMSSSFAHLSLLSSIDTKTKQIKLMQITTIIMSVIMDFIIILAIMFSVEAPWQMFAILAILIALGTLTTPIVNKVTKAPVEIAENNYIANPPIINEPTANLPPTLVNNLDFTQQATENVVIAPIFTLAQELYSISISLKSTTEKSLNSKSSRTELLKEINRLQFLVCRMNTEMLQTQTHSAEYFELIVYMNKTLCSCTELLLNQQGDYKKTVCNYIRGFHNLPKAFFPLDDRTRISVKDAMAYFESYC